MLILADLKCRWRLKHVKDYPGTRNQLGEVYLDRVPILASEWVLRPLLEPLLTF